MRPTFASLFAAAALAAGAGCLPNATWLPDSSGFVYTGGPKKDQLLLYDVKAGKARVLVDKNAGPAWPAVSPDGKKIAVALRDDDRKTIRLTVAVFDGDGKELHRSKPLDWKSHDNPKTLFAAEAFWTPKGDRLLLSTDGVGGFYDPKEQGLVKMDMMIVAAFGGNPYRPDGKGFFAFKSEQFYLIDEDGKETEVKPADQALFEKKKDEPGSPLNTMLAWPFLHSSHWEKGRAVVAWNGSRVAIDPDKTEMTLETFKPELTADKEIIADQATLECGAVVRAVELVSRWSPNNPETYRVDFGRYRLELVKPRAKEATVLMDEAMLFAIQPSPDGKSALVRGAKSIEAMMEAKPGEDWLFLIDGKGEVAAKIDTAKEVK
jgi:dipeptidyl aminopeptidase/acylaminoacyl peptidase